MTKDYKPKQEMRIKDISPAIEAELALESPVPEDLDETYKPPGSLDIPQTAIDRFKRQGYDLQWVRVYVNNGELDVNNIKRKEADKYTFLVKEDVPEMNTSLAGFFASEVDKHKDLISVGDLVLAKVSLSHKAKKRAYLENETRNRSRALVDDLRKHNFKGDYKTTRDQPTKTREIDFGD